MRQGRAPDGAKGADLRLREMSRYRMERGDEKEMEVMEGHLRPEVMDRGSVTGQVERVCPLMIFLSVVR